MNRACSLLALTVLALTGLSRLEAAEDQPAEALLRASAEAYKALTAYSDEGRFVLAATLDGKPETQRLPIRLALVRPDKLSIEAGPVRVVSDGATLTTALVPFKKYSTVPAPKTITLETFRAGPLGSVLFGGPADRPMFLLLSLLVGDDPAKAIAAEFGGALKREPDRALEGVTCRVLAIDQEKGPDYRLWIDPASKLVRGIDLVIDPAEVERDDPGHKVAITEFGWRSGAIATEAPPADTFAFEPPKGFAKIGSFADAAKAAAAAGGGEKAKYRVNDLVGKPAPDFVLSLLDGDGKIKTVSKADLAGKVVVIDFWATWCGPCLAELPEVQKIVEAYDKAKKDVVIVALSQDQRPSELGEVRKLVEKTLGQKHITLTGGGTGQIGLDPSGTVGEAFDVEAFPTVVIIDAKGVVQSAHVGFSPDVREALTKDIDTLLEGKSLVPPKGD